MVIINNQKCQLANRLWGFASFIANSIEHGYELVNIGFSRYGSYFEATQEGRFDGYPISLTRTHVPFLDAVYSKIFREWSHTTYKLLGRTPTLHKFYRITDSYDKQGRVFDLNRDDYVRDARGSKILVEGWMFRDPANVRKHRDKLVRFFSPVEPYRSEVLQDVTEARRMADVLIGVHIRRGDYENFIGGKWFYSDDVYADVMRQVAEAYSLLGKSCAFFICSNEHIDLTSFAGLNIAFRPRHFVVDLYCLAACDAIVAPPSTYSQWAAFYGGIPLTMILERGQRTGVPVYKASLLPDEDFPEKEVYRFV